MEENKKLTEKSESDNEKLHLSDVRYSYISKEELELKIRECKHTLKLYEQYYQIEKISKLKQIIAELEDMYINCI